MRVSVKSLWLGERGSKMLGVVSVVSGGGVDAGFASGLGGLGVTAAEKGSWPTKPCINGRMNWSWWASMKGFWRC